MLCSEQPFEGDYIHIRQNRLLAKKYSQRQRGTLHDHHDKKRSAFQEGKMTMNACIYLKELQEEKPNRNERNRQLYIQS